MNESCDICGADGAFGRWLDLSLCGVYEANVARCSECGFRQVRPRLSRSRIAALYPGAYFEATSPIGFADYARQQQRHEREAIFLVRRLEAISPGGRLLEVGCALGFLLEAVSRLSSWEVTGVDISPTAARFASRAYGLPVRCGTLEEAAFPDMYFDFVVQKDVLEHVARPREFLLETHRVLRSRGHVLVVTPNGEANLRPLARVASGLDLDSLPLLDQGHLSFFDLDHLLRLFTECGFDCLRARCLGVRRGLRALGYLPRKRRAPATVPRGGSRPPGGDAPGPNPEAADAEIERISAALEEEIIRHRAPLRTWLPYVYFRRAMGILDSLPARAALGNDFEFLLRKR